MNNSIKKDDHGQMMMLESVLFAVMVLMALFFVYQLSPSPSINPDTSSNQLKILGDDALRTIDKTPPESPGSYFNSKLVKFIANKEVEELTTFLDNILPDYAGYNIWIFAPESQVTVGKDPFLQFFDGESISGGKVGIVSRSHRLVVIPNGIIDEDEYTTDQEIIVSYTEPLYDVVLEMWYI